MKNWKIVVAVLSLSFFLVACKGSKCDCPSFKPKGSLELVQPLLRA